MSASIFSIMSDVVSDIAGLPSSAISGLTSILTSSDDIAECKDYLEDDCNYAKAGSQVGSAVGNALGGAGSKISSAGATIGRTLGNAACNEGGIVSGLIGSAVSGLANVGIGIATSIASSVGRMLGGGIGGAIGGMLGGALGGLFGDDSSEEQQEANDAAYIYAACQQALSVRKDAVSDCLLSATYGFLTLYANKSIVKMQNEIADRQLRLAEQLHDHAKKFWEAEDAFVDEAFGLTKSCPQYTQASNSFGKIVKDDMNAGFEDFLRFMERMCLPVSPCMQSHWDAMAGLYDTDTRNFALRNEETKAETLNNLRYSMQYAALNLGKGLPSQVMSYQQLGGSLKLNIAGFYNAILTFGFNLPRDTSKTPEYGIPQQPYAPTPEFTAPTPVPTPQPTTPTTSRRNIPTTPDYTTSRRNTAN